MQRGSWQAATRPLEGDNTIGVGKPRHVDRDLEAHRLASVAIVFSVGYILADEGVPRDIASAVEVAFYKVS